MQRKPRSINARLRNDCSGRLPFRRMLLDARKIATEESQEAAQVLEKQSAPSTKPPKRLEALLKGSAM